MAKDRPPDITPQHGVKKAETLHDTHAPATPPRLEGTEMPDHLRAQQQQAAKEPPKPVKLEPALDEDGRPADAPPVPPKAQPEPVPRVIDQSERSPDPERLRRFKVRASAPFGADAPFRYILAPKGDRQAAIDHYMETTGLQAVLDAYPEGQAPRPQFYCKELAD